MDCNRCFCTSAAKLLCTQIACVNWFNKKPYKIHKKLQIAARQGKTHKTLIHKKLSARENKTKKTPKNAQLTAKGQVNKALKSTILVARDGKSNKTLKNKKLVARENKRNKPQKHKKLAVRDGETNNTLKTKKKLKKRAQARQGKNYGKLKDQFLNIKKKAKPLEDLPVGDCLPGKVYKSGCKRCFCDDNKKAQCALKADACADADGVIKPIHTPEDVRPPFVREELKKIKTLASESEKCDPGSKYKVSCNLCVCTERGNLLCTRELCLSFEDINRVEAAEKSGEKCTQDPIPTRKGCIDCKCVDGKLSCIDIPECFADTRMKLSSGGKNNIKMKLDPMKEKCVPQGIYRDNCNRCYCQQDGTLRCTQKTCLVFSQAEELRKQLKQLKS